MGGHNDPTHEQRAERLAAALAARGRADSVPPLHWVWRLVAVAGSAAIAGSVFMPWVPLRGLERVNLVGMAVTLSRIGVPRMMWVVPVAVGAAGVAAAFIPQRLVRGVALLVLAVALGAVSAVIRTDLLRAANAAALVPLTFRSFGPGVYVYVFGIAATCAAGLRTCWPSVAGRLIMVSVAAGGLVVSAVVPRLREPLPYVAVQPGGQRVGAEPARLVYVSVRNRARHPISIVDSPPAVPDSSVYVMSLSKEAAEGGTFIEVPPDIAFGQGTSFPLMVQADSSLEIDLEFRPAWEPVPGGIQMALPFAESAAGTYRVTLSNSALGRRVDAEFVVKPVGHSQTDAATLLVEVQQLFAQGEFAEAQQLAHRLGESFPATWAARRMRELYPQIETAVSLDSEIAGAENVLVQVARSESAGDVARAVRLIDTVRERLTLLKKALPSDARLSAMVEQVEQRRVALHRKVREREARRIFTDMRTAAEQGDIDKAGALASKLASDYSNTDPYADFSADIDRVLRIERLAHAFELVSIVHVGSKVQALLLNTETKKQITVGSGEVVAGDLRVVRIDDPVGTVLIEQAGIVHELTMK